MLNELIQAAQHLPALREPPHDELKSLPKYPGYRIWLNSEGKLTSIEARLHEELLQGDDIYVWEPGGHGFRFPIFNIKPLYAPILDKEVIKAIDRFFPKRAPKKNPHAQPSGTEGQPTPQGWSEFFDRMGAACNDSTRTWVSAKSEKLASAASEQLIEAYRKSLVEVPRQLSRILSTTGLTHAGLEELIRRVTNIDTNDFFPRLAQFLRDKLCSTPDRMLFQLFCAPKLKQKDKPLPSVTLMLDLDDWRKFGSSPVCHHDTSLFLDRVLHARDSNCSTEQKDEAGFDAYGKSIKGANTNKFPSWNVPSFGKIILRAMTKDAECQARYGRFEADSFIVGKDSRDRAKAVLKELTERARKGKTWQVRAGNLVILYPEEQLDSLLNASPIALLVQNSQGDQDAAWESIEAATARLAVALDGVPRRSDVPMQVFVLRKPDGHRTKVVWHRRFKAKDLLASAQNWRDGATHHAQFRIPRWGQKKGERSDILPYAPHPDRVMFCLNIVWIRNGDESRTIKTFRYEDALELLLGDGPLLRDTAIRMLHQAVSRWRPFLCAMAHAFNQPSNKKVAAILKYKDKRVYQLAELSAILSLLLSKLGFKEHAMQTPAYFIGKLFSLTDELHYRYCEIVRNGSVPNQLIGNGLMATALEQPVTALSLYSQRILPYQAWARTLDARDLPNNWPEEKKIAARTAVSRLDLMGDICSSLTLNDLPNPPGDAERAQMILGYLAGVREKQPG